MANSNSTKRSMENTKKIAAKNTVTKERNIIIESTNMKSKRNTND